MTSEGHPKQTKVVTRQFDDLEVTIMLRWPETEERGVDAELTFAVDWCSHFLAKFWAGCYAYLMQDDLFVYSLGEIMNEVADRVNDLCKGYAEKHRREVK